jgi:TolB-like protein
VMKNSIHKILMAGLGLFIAFVLCPVGLEATHREVKVAVLPFDISSAGPFSFVGPATEEVLSSRLASGSISVMDSLEIQRITSKTQGFISSLNARDMAGKLGVDYVVTGKVIAEGEGITIDMDLLQVDCESPLFSLVFSPASLDEVPSRIEDFATQAANYILNVPKSVTTEPDTKDQQKVPQKLSQEETAQDEDLVIARMHPDLLIRQANKDSGKPERISTPSDKKSYTQELPPMPPAEPLPVPAEDDDDILLPDYPPPPDETIHYTDQTQKTSEEQTASTSLPGSEQLVLPQPPVKEEKKGWFSWIKKPWGSKDTSAQSTAPASTLPYPPPETKTAEKQVAVTIPQTSSTEQPIPTDGPIWQWY